ncbi:uncharacterized protein [Coffea arabica]|uniref:Uncharacterized protein isoform X3 n=1 Tax=Coffea arabica TaxID=13443 RepID=A0ABM4WJJ8_COFAR
MSSCMIKYHWAIPMIALAPRLSVRGFWVTQFVVKCNRDVASVATASSLPWSNSESSKSDAVTVATNKKYGSKQVSPDQAQLLSMLVQILGAKRCIEVGVYTGYSSLAIALALPEGGELIACERDAKSLEVARRYYKRAGVSHKVDVKHGLAADTLKSMILNGESCSYDFAFVDAEKRMYQEYFELLLQLIRVGGVIVLDNVLWHGKVADPLVNDAKTISIRNFNKNLMEDERVSTSMVAIGDGIIICRKR